MADIIPTNIVDEMKTSYLDYSMAVIIGRAIPSLYDGLKPVQRRVLVASKWLNLNPDAKWMKCARITGETSGKLHPQGSSYGALIGMSQWWTNNSLLIDVHGNGGSPTDGYAAERYLEAKLSRYSWEVLLQDSSSWVTRPTYDGSFQEPIELNVKIPHVLVNGAEGIAVGMACSIPPHNVRGISKALHALVEGKPHEGAKHIIPDFPTGCEVVKDDGLLEYVRTGKGSIRMRAKCEEEELDYGKRSKRTGLIFSDLPMHTNTERIGEQIKAGLEKDQITTVADVRDETDMTGTRLVVVLRANASVELAKAELYKHTSLDGKFSANNLVIDGTKPIMLAPLDVLSHWLSWRDETIIRIFTNELGIRRDRLEVLQGLMSALDMLDEIIDEIRRSKDKADARAKLMKRDFTERQANAILDMRLSQLTKLDERALRDEAKTVQARIKELIKLNSNKDLRMAFILNEVDEIAERHGNARRSKVITPPAEMQVSVIKQGKKKIEAGPKPRFIMVDESKGILTQERKMSRKSWVVSAEDRLIFVLDNGKVYKTTSRHKGPIADGPSKVLFKSKTTSLSETPLIAVWKLGDGVYANTLPWETLAKCTARGKNYLPEDAELIHLGGSYIVEKTGRKKDITLTTETLKQRPMGGKGTKICPVSDLA